MGGKGSGRKTRKQLEKEMSPQQLKKMRTHYGMGVSGAELTRVYKGLPGKKRRKSDF